MANEKVNFHLNRRDMNSAKSEIMEIEDLLNQAKTQYKNVFNEDYDIKWYHYITNAFQWFNPLNYIQSALNFDMAYYKYAQEDTFTEGYHMYSSVYGDFNSEYDIDDLISDSEEHIE
tara:strand:+ start:173 stop:523 length:351 start_codon:yes stop_codon:yes gene_type:complete